MGAARPRDCKSLYWRTGTRTAHGDPRPRGALRAPLHAPETAVGVIQPEVPFAGQEKGRAHLLLKPVVVGDGEEETAPEGQGEQKPLHAEVTHLPMVDLDLHERADLAVYHPVELGNQDDLVAKMAMLAKELYPGHALALIPVAGVKNKLRLIYDKKYLILPDLAALEVALRELNEEIGIKIKVVPVGEALGIALCVRVDFEVRDDGKLFDAQGVQDIARGVKALPGAGGAAVKIDHGYLQSLNKVLALLGELGEQGDGISDQHQGEPNTEYGHEIG